MFSHIPTSVLDGQTLDADDLFKMYTRALNTFNGGICSDMLPDNSITRAHVVQGHILSIHQERLQMPLEEDTYAYPTARGNSLAGANYGGQAGSGGAWWRVGDLSFTANEGMLTATVSGWLYLPKYAAAVMPQTTDRTAHKTSALQLRVDGQAVAETGELYGAFEPIVLTASIPVATGPTVVSVYCQVPFAASEEDTMTVVTGGGLLLTAMNRSR